MSIPSGRSTNLTPAEEQSRRWMVAAVAAAATCILIAVIHWQNPRTLYSAHGLLHTAVAQQFEGSALEIGRPENPFFAGEPLPYYWAFHYLGARISQVTGIHPLWSFQLITLAAASLLWFIAAQLGRMLYGRVLPGFAIGFFALVGANALGAWYFLAQVLTGRASIPADNPVYLWGIAHPIMGRVRFQDPNSLHGPLLNFFLNVTARPIALVLLLLAVCFLLRWMKNGRAGSWVGLLLSTAGSAALSPIIGIPGTLALVGGMVLATFIGTRNIKEEVQQWVSRGAWATAAIVAGLALASPTSYHLFQRTGESGVAVEFNFQTLGTVLASASVLLVMAGLGVWRSSGANRRFLVAVTAAAMALMTGSMIIQLPAGNSTNFFHAAAFLLAVPAAGGLAHLQDRRSGGLISAAVLLFMVPTAAIVVYAYTGRPGVSLKIEGTSIRHLPASGQLAQLYSWVERATEKDAIFVVDPRPPLWTSLGNMLEFPAMTRRVVFTGQATSYMANGYPDSELRQALAARLLGGQPLSPSDQTYLRALGRPIYLVTRHAGDPGVRTALEARYGSPAFAYENVAVFAYPLPPESDGQQ